jgi:hypothetical protein
LDIGTLAVRDSVFEGHVQPPKTQKAVRTIPLGSRAVSVLVTHRAHVSRRAPEDLVFGNGKGDPLRESKLLRNVLQPAAEAVGLGRVTWHQFRHIHSSLLKDLRVPAKIAQEQLGHASISTTLNIYTHVVDALHRAAVEAVERRLFGDLDPNGPKLAIVIAASSSTSAQQNEWRDPSPHKSSLVTVDNGVELEVLDWGGSGRALLLMHGGVVQRMCLMTWRQSFRRCRKSCRPRTSRTGPNVFVYALAVYAVPTSADDFMRRGSSDRPPFPQTSSRKQPPMRPFASVSRSCIN